MLKRDEMMSVEEHLEEAKKLYRQAVEEFEIAREKKDSTYLSDVCAKGLLSALEATYALFIKMGVREEELPKADRGHRYMVRRYASRELRLYYFSLRDNLHREGYYNRSLDFDEVKMQLEDLKYYIEKIEKLREPKGH